MFKLINDESGWEIFQNVINSSGILYAKSKSDRELLKKLNP